MGDDTMIPCIICGQPGHWEVDCAAKTKKALESRVGELEIKAAELAAKLKKGEELIEAVRHTFTPIGTPDPPKFIVQKLKAYDALPKHDYIKAVKDRDQQVWEQAREIVRTEEELEGPMPEANKKICKDIGLEDFSRATVRATKNSILERMEVASREGEG